MADVPKGEISGPGDPDHEIFDLQAFRDNGILWAMNRFVLHPKGLAMWMHAVPPAIFESAESDKVNQEIVGWGIKRAKDGIWTFDYETDMAGRDKFNRFLEYINNR